MEFRRQDVKIFIGSRLIGRKFYGLLVAIFLLRSTVHALFHAEGTTLEATHFLSGQLGKSSNNGRFPLKENFPLRGTESFPLLISTSLY